MPYRIRTYAESFIIETHDGILIAAFYFDDDASRAVVTRRVSRAEALAHAKTAARALTEKENAEAAAQPSKP